MTYFTDGDSHITEPLEVTTNHSTHYATFSSNNRYGQDFRRIRLRKERCRIDFQANQNFDYNSDITILEIKQADQKFRNTDTREGNIHFQLLKSSFITC